MSKTKADVLEAITSNQYVMQGLLKALRKAELQGNSERAKAFARALTELLKADAEHNPEVIR